MTVELAGLKADYSDVMPTVTFYEQNHDLMIHIQSGVLTGRFKVNAKELKILKQLLRRFH